MANYVALQADEGTLNPKNLKAVALGGGEDGLAVALYVDAETTPTPLLSTMFAASATPTTVTAGTTALSTVAAQLPSHAGKAVLIQNDPDNTIDVFIGDASSQPLQLLPGESFVAEVSNLNAFYMKSASATPSVNWLVMS